MVCKIFFYGRSLPKFGDHSRFSRPLSRRLVAHGLNKIPAATSGKDENAEMWRSKHKKLWWRTHRQWYAFFVVGEKWEINSTQYSIHTTFLYIFLTIFVNLDISSTLERLQIRGQRLLS